MSVVRAFFYALGIAASAAFCRAQAPAGTLPTVLSSPAAVTIVPGGNDMSIDLTSVFGLPGVAGQLVQMQTILGNITIELYPQSAPRTVANFLSYVDGGLFNNIFINRSVPGFVIQGGGFTISSANVINAVATLGTVANETKLSNLRGTLAMARTSDPNSASNQWFINLADNGGSPTNLDTTTGGYTVFARVIGTGMTVADAIAALKTYALDTGNFANCPLYNVSSTATTPAYSNWVRFPRIARMGIYPDGSGSAAALGFSVSSSDPTVVSPSVLGSSLSLAGLSPGSAVVTVTATDNNGNQASTSFSAVVAGLIQQPVSATVAPGSTAVFSVGLSSVPDGTTYQWKLNGVPVSGATGPRLVIGSASAASAGSYTCVVSTGGGTLTSNSALLSLSSGTPGHLINLSVLTTDITPGQSLTLGFVIGGATGKESVLLRAAGPALAAFGLSSLLPDPQLTLFNAASTPLASNAGWSSTPGNQTAVNAADTATGAFALSPGSLDSAMVQSLSAGSGSAGYSISITGKSNDGGTALGEVYDDSSASAFTAAATHLQNLSSSLALPAGRTLTAGFTIGGLTAKTVLIRAVGPGLSSFGVPSVMPDPQLKLFSGTAVVASNAGWGGDPQLAAAAASRNAFPLAPGSADSVILTTLSPGGYSAQVNSLSGTGGTALVEVYELP
jgi:cyclophilin family peptidyl-prolyl cis-trans isomerase